MDGKRAWHGTVKAGAREAHDKFVEWLRTPAAELQFSKFLLTSYELAEDGDNLTVTMGAAEPPPIIRFLRNPQMWPGCWEFKSSGPAEAQPTGTVRVAWQRG
jgi:hypothetical protein